MKNRIIFLLILGIMLVSCSDKDVPSLVFSGEFICTTPGSNIPEDTYDPYLEKLFNPSVENVEKSSESYVSTGDDFKDIVIFEIKNDKGFLTVTTTKQQITSNYKTYERILTFSEGLYLDDTFEIKSDGIYRIAIDGDNRYLVLQVALNNFQKKDTYSALIDLKNEDVTTVFKGQTENPFDKKIVIKEGNEEYKLEYISNNEIFIQQTQPLNRGIGILDLN